MSDFPHKCPCCGSDAFIGFISTQCSARTCDNYVAPKVNAKESSPPEEPASIDPRLNPWAYPTYLPWTAGAHPNASQDDDDKGPSAGDLRVDPVSGDIAVWSGDAWEYTGSGSTTSVTASTPLKEVHDSLSEEEKSQLQSLESSLDPIDSLLATLVVHLRGTMTGSSGPLFALRTLGRMTSALSDLRAKLPDLEDTLEQCDQFLHRLQSGDQHPSENHKSEELCQTDKVPCHACGASPTNGIYHMYEEVLPGLRFCSRGCLDSSVSKSRVQSCEKQSPECRVQIAPSISLDAVPDLKNELLAVVPANVTLQIHDDPLSFASCFGLTVRTQVRGQVYEAKGSVSYFDAHALGWHRYLLHETLHLVSFLEKTVVKETLGECG